MRSSQRSLAPETVSLLTNRGVIAIDQDPLGRPARRGVQRGPLEIWTRPLDGKRTAVTLFNRDSAPATIEARLGGRRSGVPRREAAREGASRSALRTRLRRATHR